MNRRSATPRVTTRGRPTRRQSFAVVLAIEVWERFGYYGTQSILILFMVQRLGLPDAQANLLWGAASALIYAAPAIGGLVGDRVLGTRRTMLLGGVTLTAAYALLAIPTSDAGTAQLTLALATVVVGNGLFKPNAANLVRLIYEGDAKLDQAFTIYYMSVNVGSTAAILLAPVLEDRFGWHAAFALSAGGLALGLCIYAALAHRVVAYGSLRDHQPLRRFRTLAVGGGMLAFLAAADLVLGHALLARAFVYAAGAAVLGAWTFIYRASKPAERAGLLAMYLLTAQVMIFFIFYQQTATSLTLFALRCVSLDLSVGGLHLFRWSPAQFQALDPIWIVLLTPLLVRLYDRRAARGRDFPIAAKFAAGNALLAGAFLLWWLAAANAHGPVSSWVMVWAYGLFSAGELLTSALGLAACARYVPARISGFMMGSFFVTLGLALYAGSALANLAAMPALGAGAAADMVLVYAGLFRRLFMLACAGLLVSILLIPTLRRLDRLHLRI